MRLPDAVVKALDLKTGDEIEIVVAGTKRFEVRRDRGREQALARLRALKNGRELRGVTIRNPFVGEA